MQNNKKTIIRLRKRVGESILILVIPLLCLLALELGLRMVFPDKLKHVGNRGERIDHPDYYKISHPEYIFELKPNILKTFTRKEWNGGQTISWRTNKHSFRGNALRNDSEIRIIVYGDSNIQAKFSRLEDTFPVKVEKYLKVLQNKKVEVVNAGVSGFGPDQSLLKLSSQVDIFKPSIIVFHVFADNDYGDLIRNQLFDVIDGTLVRRTNALDRLFVGPLQKGREFASSLLITRATRKLLKSIVFWPVESQNNAQAIHSQEKEGGIKKEPHSKLKAQAEYVAKLISSTNNEYAAYKQERTPIMTDHYDIDIALDPKSESATTKVTLMELVLVEAYRLAQSKGLPFLVLIQPSWIDITTNDDDLDYRYLAKYSSYDRKRLTSIVEDICIRYGIHHINLFKPFSKNDPNKLYFQKNDNHWNTAGQDLAARKAAEYIHSYFLEL